jgi:hypothetical protein
MKVINPVEGSFIFFYDFDTFKISKDITIVGVENSRNFRALSFDFFESLAIFTNSERLASLFSNA